MTDVDELMTRMTIEEKCAQLGCVWFSALMVNGEFASGRLETVGNGIGQIARVASESSSGPERVQSFPTAFNASSSKKRGLGSRPSYTKSRQVASVHERPHSSPMASASPRPGTPNSSRGSPRRSGVSYGQLVLG